MLIEVLQYPLEFYYPDYNFNNLTNEEKIIAHQAYKESFLKQESEGVSSSAFKAMVLNLNIEKKVTYFQGVRDILNLLFAQQKTPEHIYLSLFPDREKLVSIFQQQFLDATNLLTHSDEVDWERMNLSWEKFHRSSSKINYSDIEQAKRRILKMANEQAGK